MTEFNMEFLRQLAGDVNIDACGLDRLLVGHQETYENLKVVLMRSDANENYVSRHMCLLSSIGSRQALSLLYDLATAPDSPWRNNAGRVMFGAGTTPELLNTVEILAVCRASRDPLVIASGLRSLAEKGNEETVQRVLGEICSNLSAEDQEILNIELEMFKESVPDVRRLVSWYNKATYDETLFHIAGRTCEDWPTTVKELHPILVAHQDSRHRLLGCLFGALLGNNEMDGILAGQVVAGFETYNSFTVGLAFLLSIWEIRPPLNLGLLRQTIERLHLLGKTDDPMLSSFFEMLINGLPPQPPCAPDAPGNE